MGDIIQVLPDHIANQIAAGEVVQRPASAVKELLENAIDAEADKIQLYIEDAGKSLIQVIDNGKGMSLTDARMAFERHATSKIRSTEDLFAIRSKGFRGEALASIAAIAKVDLKTKQTDEDLGTHLYIEGGKTVRQEPCQTPQGSIIRIQSLFYNVPARRKFLKSDKVELRHIYDEFERVAIAHPAIHFELHHNNNRVFHLPESTLRQRIVNVFGSKMNEKLVPVQEETDVVKVSGFVVKPEFAKKSKGEQFFFVNHRFIKSGFLHHAVKSAYDQLISADQHPAYFIFLELDPGFVDVNIHPTKTEVKFEDERTIHAILNSTVKKSLGQFNLKPSLDFDQDPDLVELQNRKPDRIVEPKIQVDPNYNPFQSKQEKPRYEHHAPPRPDKKALEQWDQIMQSSMNDESDTTTAFHAESKINFDDDVESSTEKLFIQLHRKYILTKLNSGYIILHQQRAHERVLYEKFREAYENTRATSQQLLFQQPIEMAPGDAETLSEHLSEIQRMGFDIEPFGANAFIVNGVPHGLQAGDLQQIFEKFVEQAQHSSENLQNDSAHTMALLLARSLSIKPGKRLERSEMINLAEQLFVCKSPAHSPTGKNTMITLDAEELDKRFQ